MPDEKTIPMPLATSRDAPRFSENPDGFDDFWDAVEELGRRAKASQSDLIKWAARYASADSSAWRRLESYTDPDATLAEFKLQVSEIYPNLAKDQRYTSYDLVELVENTARHSRLSREDFGDYYRKFFTISHYLMGQQRIAKPERSRLFLKGLTHDLKEKTMQRLSIIHHNVRPSDGYDLKDLKDATLWVLVSDEDIRTETAVEHIAPTPPSPPTPAPINDQQYRGLLSMIETLARTVDANTRANANVLQTRPPPPPVRNAAPAPGVAVNNPPPGGVRSPCRFCGSTEHFIRNCRQVEEYVNQGKARRTNDGKLTFPDGTFPNRYTPGSNLREQLDYAYSNHQHQAVANYVEHVAVNFLESNEEYAIEVEVSPTTWKIENENGDADVDAEVYIGERRGKQVLDHVSPGRPRPGPSKKKPENPPGPTIHAQPRRDIPPHLAGNPKEPENGKPSDGPRGPQKPSTFPAKPQHDEAKFRYQSAVETTVKTAELLDRALDASVLVTTRELLAGSSDVRRQLKDLITSKKVSVNLLDEDSDRGRIEPGPSFTTDDRAFNLKHSSEPTTSVAAHTLPLRVIYPSFGSGMYPECILDSGATVVAMSARVWKRLGVPLSSDKLLTIKCANDESVSTLGVVEKHPVRIGPITVYLQIQVIDGAAYDVLLGRPFFDVLSCSEISSAGGDHMIRVTDPRTRETCVIPTLPRDSHRNAADEAVNFHR